jgi:hypothetical protein
MDALRSWAIELNAVVTTSASSATMNDATDVKTNTQVVVDLPLAIAMRLPFSA